MLRFQMSRERESSERLAAIRSNQSCPREAGGRKAGDSNTSLVGPSEPELGRPSPTKAKKVLWGGWGNVSLS